MLIIREVVPVRITSVSPRKEHAKGRFCIHGRWYSDVMVQISRYSCRVLDPATEQVRWEPRQWNPDHFPVTGQEITALVQLEPEGRTELRAVIVAWCRKGDPTVSGEVPVRRVAVLVKSREEVPPEFMRGALE